MRILVQNTFLGEQFPHPRGGAASERLVDLRLRPQGVSYSIDGGPLVPYVNRIMPLRVGRHEFRIVGNDATCHETSWTQDIAADTVPLVIRRTLDCDD